MLDLYAEDEKIITTIVDKVRGRMMDGREVTGENLSRLHDELMGRLQDAGYVVSVDVTPLLAGYPPVVNVAGKQDVQEFDFERKGFELKKRAERKEKDPDITGMV